MSLPSCDYSENNNSISVKPLFVQSSIEIDDSSNEGNISPLSIEGNACHTQEIDTEIMLNFKT